MRSEETNRPRFVTAALIGLLLPWVCVADVWTPGNEPYAGSIHRPQDGDVFACGAPVGCACSGATDWDVWTTEGDCPFSGEALDLMSLNHPLWVASHGSFKDGDNIGLSVTWIAPGSPISGITFRYYDEDRPKEIGPYDSGTRDDIPPDPEGFLQDTVSGVETIIPDVNRVWFGYVPGQPDAKHDINDVNRPEYNRNPYNNDPACYTMGSTAYVTVRFWHAKTLDQVVDVNVCGVTVGDGGNIGDWDVSPLVSRWQTSWEMSQASACTAVDSINDSIQRCTYDTYWYYWCPDGLFAWIPTTVVQDSELFVVYDGPKCDNQHYTKSNIREAIDKALWQSTEPNIASKANDNVADGVFIDSNSIPCICADGFQVNFDAAMGRYPANPPKGMCCCRAEGLNCVLQVLGIGPYTHDYVNEWPEPNPTKLVDGNYCSVCGRFVERNYWDGFWNCWEGVVKRGGNGSTCYAPANGSISIDEGTYDQIDNAIAADCGYYWRYSDGGLFDFEAQCPHLEPPE